MALVVDAGVKPLPWPSVKRAVLFLTAGTVSVLGNASVLIRLMSHLAYSPFSLEITYV